MSESQLYAAAGAGILALCAYIQSRNNQQRQWLRLVRDTPESSVAAVWEQLERLEQGTVGKRARPVIFVKLKGETWAPERDAVPDRFGKPAVLVETQTFAERWKCVPVPAQTKRSNDASPAEDVRYHWEREVQLLDTSRRGSSLFLRDPNYVEGVQEAEVESWMKGRVDACSRILRLCPGQEQVVKECDLWRKDLQDLRRRAQAGVHVSASDELRRWEAANVRVDDACFNWKDMLSHNSCKITPVNQEPRLYRCRIQTNLEAS